MKETCNDCVHAKWQRGPSGKVIWQRKGECTVEYVLDDAPHCVRESYDFKPEPARRAIWWNDNVECPAYAKKGAGE